MAPRILVVDDEPMVRWLVARTLTDAGYLVDEASDGLARWEVARTTPKLDLVITDSRMRASAVPNLCADCMRSILRSPFCNFPIARAGQW